MSELAISLKGVPEVVQRLRDIPGGSQFALRAAILKSLTRGRTEASKIARSRYNISAAWIRKSLGTPRMNGPTSGFLRSSGEKSKLSMFPFRSIPPYGVAFAELKEGLPSQIHHAFVGAAQGAAQKQIYGRETPETKKYPIRVLTGLSAPGMLGGEHTLPQLHKLIASEAQIELQRVLRLVLNGDIKMRST
jgi:hypothetical protein